MFEIDKFQCIDNLRRNKTFSTKIIAKTHLLKLTIVYFSGVRFLYEILKSYNFINFNLWMR